MSKVYSVNQSLKTGKIIITEFNIIEETDTTVKYRSNGIPYTKHKDSFDKIQPYIRYNTAEKFTDIYILTIAEDRVEAITHIEPILEEWISSLKNGLSKALLNVVHSNENKSDENKYANETLSDFLEENRNQMAPRLYNAMYRAILASDLSETMPISEFGKLTKDEFKHQVKHIGSVSADEIERLLNNKNIYFESVNC